MSPGAALLRVLVESNFDLGRDRVELPGDSVSLQKLLAELGQLQQPAVDFLDRQTGDVDDLFIVSINGQEYKDLPGRLNLSLKDGDKVRIEVAILGGGQGRASA